MHPPPKWTGRTGARPCALHVTWEGQDSSREGPDRHREERCLCRHPPDSEGCLALRLPIRCISFYSFQSFQPSLNLRICSDACLGNEGCLVVASALSRLPSLSKLYLHNNSLDDDGCLEVARALTGLSTLEVLSSVSTSSEAGVHIFYVFNF